MENKKIVTFLPWDEIELEAQEQIKNTASMPFIHRHIAVMPDCHYGKGATVGTVMPTVGAIVPAAVGVDIEGNDKYLEIIGNVYEGTELVV